MNNNSTTDDFELTPVKIILGLAGAVVIVSLIVMLGYETWQFFSGDDVTGEYATNLVGTQFLTYAYTEGEPMLGNQVVFPDGWIPVLYASNGSAEGRYICERDGEYRVCIPRVDEVP